MTEDTKSVVNATFGEVEAGEITAVALPHSNSETVIEAIINETDRDLSAAYGIQLVLVVQSLSALRELYSHAWEAFVGNAAALVLVGAPADKFTAEYLSARSGDTTIIQPNAGLQLNPGGMGVSSGEGYTRRRYLSPSDLYDLPPGYGFVFMAGMADPIPARFPPYWTEEPTKSRARGVIHSIAGDVMDDMMKKLLSKCDSQFPGERVNALDLLYDHLQKVGQTFAGLVHEFEQAVPAQKYADLERLYNTAAQENAQWAQRYQKVERALASATRQLALYKQAIWLKLNWHIVAPVAVGLAVAWFGYSWWTRPAWPDNSDSYLSRIVRDMIGDKIDQPFVVSLGNQSFWLLMRSETDDTSYVDRTNHPVVMQCVHLFGGPAAEAAGGQYYKPQPYSLFGLGWLQWPERYADCQKSANQTVVQK